MSAADDDFADNLRRALTATVRAIAEEPHLNVTFTGKQAVILADEIRLPAPSALPSAHEMRQMRAVADRAAIRRLYHAANLHNRNTPVQPRLRSLFDAFEDARIETLGGDVYPGILSNVNDADTGEIGALLKRPHVDEQALEHVYLRAHVRSVMSGKPLPDTLAAAMPAWMTSALTTAALKPLLDTLHSQADYADKTRALLRSLDLGLDEMGDEPSKSDQTEDSDEDKTENTPDPASDDEDGEDGETMPASGTKLDSVDLSGDLQSLLAMAEEGEEDSEDGEVTDGSQPVRTRPNFAAGAQSTQYKIYTSAYDEVIAADELAEPVELERLRAMLDAQLEQMHTVIARLANKLQRKLLAQQRRSWQFDLEEGIIDSARFGRLIANPAFHATYKQESEAKFKDTVVTLLIDNSGSMRGRPISIAAMSTDIIARSLERCGVKVEILGFTTRTWKGGAAREKWITDGKPPLPGRLNDLRHIVYKSADQPWRHARLNLGLMLKEGLLKENIDGEALLWAHERLLRRNEDRRIMMVISDGAPVDDSTLSCNPGHYLETHLREVIDWIEARSPVRLSAIGIGHDVTRYYRRAITITDARDLGAALIERLDELFDDDVSSGNAYKRRMA